MEEIEKIISECFMREYGYYPMATQVDEAYHDGFITCSKKMYSKEDMEKCFSAGMSHDYRSTQFPDFKTWVENYKK